MTGSIRLDNARNLYLRGIRDGDIDTALDAYIGAEYIQHSGGVADGKDGFRAFDLTDAPSGVDAPADDVTPVM